MAEKLIDSYRTSIMKVCGALKLHRPLFYYKPSDKPDAPLAIRIHEIAAATLYYEEKAGRIIINEFIGYINKKD